MPVAILLCVILLLVFGAVTDWAESAVKSGGGGCLSVVASTLYFVAAFFIAILAGIVILTFGGSGQ